MSAKAKQTKLEPSPVKREISALFFLAIGVFFYISLFSYNPRDPSFLNLTTGAIHNWGGVIGSYLSDSLLFLFGGGAYFIGFFFLLAFILVFSGAKKSVHLIEVALYLIFVVFTAVLFQMGKGFLHYGKNTIPAGGFLGSLLGQAGIAYLGRAGAYLVVLVGAMLTFVWATRLTIREMGKGSFKILAPMASWIAQQSSIYYARAKKSVLRWWEERQIPKPSPPPELKINRQISSPQPPEASAPLGSKTLAVPAEVLPGGGPKILERVDKKKSKPNSPQLTFQSISGDYELPPLNLLDCDKQGEEVVVDEESLKMNARILEKKLLDFGVDGKVTEIHPGPLITMYEFEPAPGIKLSRIANLVDDLCLAMGGRSVRIVAPLPNKPAVGIEIPNNTRETVWLKDVIADEKFRGSESKLVLALGKDIEGIPFVADLAKMPHLLVAGATGSGKSVSINSMILSLLYKAKPEEVRMIMVDPKMLELSLYEGIPHLLLPVVTEPKKASLALRWAVREMERRYKLLSDINARNILNYNKKIEKGNFESKQPIAQIVEGEEGPEPIKHEGKLPYIVIIVDELADLMMVSSREVEESITRLAQMARAAGIHLILATQRPSVDVLTGVIKANFPARISFKVSSKFDARTILDTIGSERLLGNGDMLFVPPGASRMLRVHGAYISETEVSRIVDFLKKQAKPVYDETILKVAEVEAAELEEGGGEADELYDQAVAIVAETRQASISMIQRKLRVGYNRAARMIEKMELEGIVSAPTGAGQRQVLVASFQNPQ